MGTTATAGSPGIRRGRARRVIAIGAAGTVGLALCAHLHSLGYGQRVLWCHRSERGEYYYIPEKGLWTWLYECGVIDLGSLPERRIAVTVDGGGGATGFPRPTGRTREELKWTAHEIVMGEE